MPSPPDPPAKTQNSMPIDADLPAPFATSLSVKALDSLPERTREALASRGALPAVERERFDTARHESAHLVAAWAMAAPVTEVCVNQSDQPRLHPVGNINASCLHQREEAFVSCAGVAWEDQFGNPVNASVDLLDATNNAASNGEDLTQILPFTRTFVAASASLIDQVAVALFRWAQSNPRGRIANGKLRALRSWGEPRLPSFNGYASGRCAIAALPRSELKR